MPVFDWDALMRPWSAEVLADPELRPFVDADALASGWLGLPGASEADLAATEARLDARLPESYRQFLAYSNGWRMLNAFVENLWSAEEVERYAVRHADLVDAWRRGRTAGPVSDAAYFVYGAEQDPSVVRDEYLANVIEVSDYADGVLLLNPAVVFDDGEWEAWFFAPWLPGAKRYRSFWDMLQALRAMPS
jgi:hypothetical protein